MSLRRSVHPLVGPHDAITWKTSYVAIDSRRGGGRGKLVTSRFSVFLFELFKNNLSLQVVIKSFFF
jgi:hypothetical protein